MDLVSSALIAALAGGIAELSQGATGQAYRALRLGLLERFGRESELAQAVELLERKPDSPGRQELLREEISATGADREPHLLATAQALLERLDGGRPARFFSLAGTIPVQRLTRAAHFTGREKDLAHLLSAIRPGRVVVVNGPPGVGKSALVAEALTSLAPLTSAGAGGETPPAAFPAGILYHNFDNQPRVDIALEQIARFLGRPPTPTPYDAAQQALAGRPALLLLEGADQADDLPGLLAVRGQSGLVLTGQQVEVAGASRLTLGPLPPDQALALLRAWRGVQAPAEAAVRRVCELVGELPLAVSLAGQYLAARQEDPADFLTWLKGTPLNLLKRQQRQHEAVPLIVEHSLAQASDTARQTLAVAGLLALAPFSPDAVAKTMALETTTSMLPAIRRLFRQKTEEPAANIGPALRELTAYGLLRPVGDRYIITHALIRVYARQHLAAPARTVRRLAAYFMALAWELTALGPEGYARLDADLPHVMQVLVECLEWEDWEAAHGLAVASEDYLDRQGYWAERVLTNEVGLIAAWQLGRPSEGAWLGNLGDTYRTMGHAKWAIEHFKQALITARQANDRDGEGNSLGNLGLAYRDLGQLAQALHYLQQSLAVFETIRSPKAGLVREWLEALAREIEE